MSIPGTDIPISVFGGDFARLQEVIRDLNERFSEPLEDMVVRLWPDMDNIDLTIAELEADDIIDRALVKYKNTFSNPSFFENLTGYCQQKYRDVIKDWMVEHGRRNSQGRSRSIRDGEAS